MSTKFNRFTQLILPITIALFLIGALVLVLAETAVSVNAANGGGDLCFVETTGDNSTDYSSGDAGAVQTAVNAASPNDVLKIAGTCAGVQFQNGPTQTVYISKSLTLQGGYSELDWTFNPTLYTTTLNAEQQERVIYLTSGITVTIETLTLTGGDSYRGGGIYNAGSALTLSTTKVISNVATDRGGGIYNDGQLQLMDSTVTSNSSGSDAGGIYSEYGDLTIADTTIANNIANSNAGGIKVYSSTLTMTNSYVLSNTSLTSYAGGMYLLYGNDVYISDSVISGNQADAYAGGLYNYYATGTQIKNSSFYSNTSLTSYAGGLYIYQSTDTILENISVAYNWSDSYAGGIYNYRSTNTEILSATISNNSSSTSSAGGLYNYRSPQATIAYSTISNNIAGGFHSGGIYNYGSESTLTVTHSALYGNSAASYGGGIANRNGAQLIFMNSTLSNNHALGSNADQDGGGGFAQTSNAPSATFINSTIANNDAVNVSDADGIRVVTGTVIMSNTIVAYNGTVNCSTAVNTFSSAGYNLEDSDTCGFTATGDITNTNPLLDNLADNGGATWTHALVAGSPAINAGDLAYPVLAGDYDQRGMGFVRVVNGRLDIGAYEYIPPSVCFVETTGDNTTDYDSWDASAVQTAVNAASPNDLIKIAGTCAGVQFQNALTQTVYISQSLTMQGGYTSTNWMAAPDPDLYPTLLDAAENGRVVVAQGTGIQIALDSLTIMNGNANDGTLSDNGGGVWANQPITLTNVLLTNNNADYSGGAVYVADSATVTQSTFDSNDAARNGGGIYVDHSGLLTMQSSVLMHNDAPGNGITSGIGGAMYLEGGADGSTIDSSWFYSNTATYGAGLQNYATTIISNTTLQENKANVTSGAIGNANSSSHLTLNNVTISGNSASGGGGINHGQGNMTIHSSTIVSNTANSGGGISVSVFDFAPSVDALPEISNSIIALNSAQFSGDNCYGDGVVDNGYNLESADECGLAATGSLTNTLPSLAPLANNGGPAIGANGAYYLPTHALLSGSPAIDAGDPAYPILTGDYDQRGMGFPRVNNGRLDIGSYESPPSVCFVETTGDNTTDYDSYDASAVQTAVNAAAPNDLIKIAGTCAGVNTTNGLMQTVYLSTSLTLQGGYDPLDWSTQDTSSYTTTLDAMGLGRVAIISGTINVTLDGLLIRNGQADVGGGVYITADSVVTLTNNTFTENTAVSQAGAVGNLGQATISNSIFTNNNAYVAGAIGNGAGGIMLLEGSTLSANNATKDGGTIANLGTITITVSTFISNSAKSGGAIGNSADYRGVTGEGMMHIEGSTFRYNTSINNGGVIDNDDGGTLTIVGSLFTNNAAGKNGGSITQSAGSGNNLTITNSTFISNTAIQWGGALYISTGTAVINGSTFDNQTAVYGGAIATRSNGALTISDSSFIGNSATDFGGALFTESPTDLTAVSLISNTAKLGGGMFHSLHPLTITNSTVQDNTAANAGGGLVNYDGDVTIINSTLSGNVANTQGGGLYSLTPSAAITLTFSTVTSNTAPSGAGVFIDNSTFLTVMNSILSGNSGSGDCTSVTATLQSGGYNLLGAGCTFTTGTDIATTTPGLAPLADNGGGTWTHALLSNSPAVNMIPTTVNGCGTTYVTDQRGKKRPFANGCDSGAYEVNMAMIFLPVILK